MSDTVEELLQTHAKVATERANFDSMNQEIAELVLPEHGTFTTKDRSQGNKWTQRQYDTTAQTEAKRHAAAVDSLTTPAGEKWGGIAAKLEALNERDDVQQYCEDVMDVVRSEREAGGFQEAIFDVWRLGGVFGTSALYPADKLGGGIQYKAIHTSEIYVLVDAWGREVALHRKWKLSAKAAADEYGENCPAPIKEAAVREPTRQYEFLQCIKKNDKRSGDHFDARGMPYVSYEVAVEHKIMLRQSGFWSWPMPVYHYNKAPGEWYGRGWAAEVLPDIKLLNRMEKAHIRQTEKSVDPPLLLHGDGMLDYGSSGVGHTPSLAAGSLNHNAVTDEGKPLVVPLFTGADLSKGEQKMERLRRNIRDASLSALFQIFADRERMTATEFLGLMQEKGQMIGPMIGRSATTFLMQVQEREIDILARQGRLPPMPRALQAAAGEYKTTFNSPLTRLMKLREVMQTEQWVAGLLQVGELYPDVLELPDYDKIARESAKARGVPAAFVKDKDVIEKSRAARQQQQSMQQMVEAAPQVAVAAKDFAQADAITRDAQLGRAVQALRGALRGQ